MAMEISIEDSMPDLTDEQKREIDRRISAYEANPEDVMTWDEVKASILKSRDDRIRKSAQISSFPTK
jgi:putative addiction module component (TIGR02574 family)